MATKITNNGNEQQNKPIKERKVFKIGIIILFIIAVFLVLLDPILNMTAKGMLEDRIKNSANGRKAKIGSMSYSLLTNNLSFDDIDITLGNNSKYSEKTINLQAGSLEFDGVNWFSFVFSDKLSLDEIIITAPYIVVFDSSSSNNPEDSTSDEDMNSLFSVNEIYNSIPQRMLPLSMDFFKIISGELVSTTILDSEITKDTLVNINFNLDDIEISKEKQNKKLLIAEDFELQIDSLIRSNVNDRNFFKVKNVNISSLDSSVQISKIEYKPSVSIEEYFSKKKYSSECFTVDINDLQIVAMDFSSLVKEKSILIDKISTSNFYFDVVIDKRLPSKNDAKPQMPAQLLQSLDYKVRVNTIFAEGNIYHRAIHKYFDEYAKIFFTNVQCEVNNLTNYGEEKCLVDISSYLQDKAKLSVNLSIDLTNPQTFFSYYGQLGSMDARELNSHLKIEDKVEVNSGEIESISYDVSVTDSIATVSVKPIYHNLSMQVIDEKNKSEKEVQTFLANKVKLRKSNPAKDKEPVVGKVKYIRKENDAFLDFVWQALLSGLGKVVGF